MKNAWTSAIEHGFGIMMSGFVVAVVAVLLHMKFRHDHTLGAIFFAVAIAGFAVYIFGRVLVFIRKRMARQTTSAEEESPQ